MFTLSYERRGDISFMTNIKHRNESDKTDITESRCDNLFITYLCLYLEQKAKNQIIFSNYLYFEYISKWIQNYCLKYAKQVESTKTNQT